MLHDIFAYDASSAARPLQRTSTANWMTRNIPTRIQVPPPVSTRDAKPNPNRIAVVGMPMASAARIGRSATALSARQHVGHPIGGTVKSAKGAIQAISANVTASIATAEASAVRTCAKIAA